MIKLYGSPITRAQRVMWMLEELEIPYDHIPAVSPSTLGTPIPKQDLQALNPSGKVPILVDGDLVVTESLVINLHLASSRPSALTPDSSLGWLRAAQWTSWVLAEIESPLTRIIGVRRLGALSRLAPKQLDEDRFFRFCVQHAFGTLEARLRTAPWLVEDRFTVGDLNVASVLALAEPSGIDFSGLPHTYDWLRRCLTRPAARATWNKVLHDAKALGQVGDMQVAAPA